MAVTGSKKSPIEGFEHYEITEEGDVHVLQSCDISNGYVGVLSKRIDRAGYLTVRLSRDGKTYTKYIHRLIAEAFIPNPEGKKYINHLSGRKTENSIKNLCWVSHKENILHAYQAGLIAKASCKRRVINTCTGELFSSVREAAIFYSIPYSTLKNYLNGSRSNPTNLDYK